MFHKKEKNGIPADADEALFNALNDKKKKKRRKIIRTVAIVLVLLAGGAVVGIRVLQRQVRQQFATTTQEVLSQAVERGSISTVVSGSGMLANVDTKTVSVPSGVEVSEILVKYGDTVKAGDLLATVDMASVRTAMSTLQDELDSLDSQIASAKSDKVSSSVTAGVPGRLKQLYVQQGTLVEDAMVQYGALAVLSLDGYMAVDIETSALQKGDTVTVLRADGTSLPGSVETAAGGTATILVTDNGPACDEMVTVRASSGETLGTGALYIHSPLKVTGYAGTVGWVNVSLNQTVYASSTLFSLTETSTSASYNALLRSRGKKEETLLELLQIQRSSGLTAPIDGTIYSVADLNTEDGTAVTDIVTISPDVSMSVTVNVDESDILSLAVGQTATVTVRSVGDDTVSGVVTEVDRTASSGSYTAVITMDKVQGMLPGMTANVKVRIEGVDDALLIPVDALHQTSAGYYVYTSYDEETQTFGGKVDVVPGLQNSTSVEIKSGLTDGDTVYYTKKQSFGDMFSFSMMPASGSGSSGGGMPSFGGGQGGSSSQGGSRPSFGGGQGGGMPNFGGQGGRGGN